VSAATARQRELADKGAKMQVRYLSRGIIRRLAPLGYCMGYYPAAGAAWLWG